MKYFFITYLTILTSSLFAQQIELVEKGRIKGAIFPKNYELLFTQNLGQEFRFTATSTDVYRLEKELKRGIKLLNKNRPNQEFLNDPIIHRNLKKYVRQYIGYIDKNGDRIIYINFIWNYYSLLDFIRAYTRPEDSWKTQWMYVLDGGSKYWTVKYNLDKNYFFDLQVNGLG